MRSQENEYLDVARRAQACAIVCGVLFAAGGRAQQIAISMDHIDGPALVASNRLAF